MLVRVLRVPTLLVITLSTSAAGQVSCGGAGLSLSANGGRLGDPFSIFLSGPPGGSGLFAHDTSPGPAATPFGAVCLGLSASLQVMPIALDQSGSFAFTAITPPDPALSNLTVSMQAAVVDTTQPSGIALSNGLSPTFRSS